MKTLLFSRHFPAGHSKEGQRTHFVEKIMACLADRIPGWKMKDDFVRYDWYEYYNCTMPKGHTVRAGTRFSPGDMVSLREWSDKPYRSKQIEFAQVEVKKVISVTIHIDLFLSSWIGENTDKPNHWRLLPLCEVAKNDGLECEDFVDWFKIHPKKDGDSFTGQIVCWSSNIEY